MLRLQFPPGAGSSRGIYCTGDVYVRKRDKCGEIGESPTGGGRLFHHLGCHRNAVATHCFVCQQLFVKWWTVRAEPECCLTVHTDAHFVLLKVWHTIHNKVSFSVSCFLSCYLLQELSASYFHGTFRR